MKKKSFYLRGTLLLGVLTTCTLSLTGCFNDDYDLKEIDKTVGIGGGELHLPTSTTDIITLDDVLDLNPNDCVKLDEDGNYIFKQDGGEVDMVSVEIAEVEVAKTFEETYPLEMNVKEMLNLPDLSEVINNPLLGSIDISDYIDIASIKALAPITVDKDIQVIKYNKEKPEEIVDIVKADVDATTKIVVPVAELKKIFNKVKSLSIDLPIFMDVVVTKPTSGYTIENNILTFENISTANDLEIELNIHGLDVSRYNDKNILEVTDEEINIDCGIHMSVTVDPADIVEETFTNTERFLDMYNNSAVALEAGMGLEGFVIKGAQGYFDPSIQLNDLGSVSITGVPEFLTDGDVVVDLYNPAVLLTLESDLDVEGFIDGTIVAAKDGAPIAKVDIKGIKINAGEDTKICLCRHTDDKALKARLGEGYTYYAVPDLSTLIETIPDNISFTAKARANNDYLAHFQLGHKYTLKPNYSVEAPVAFAEKANIVYDGVEKDINKDIKDYELADGAYIQIDAEIENHVPAFLTLEVNPLDLNGHKMKTDEVDIIVNNTVIAPQPGYHTITPITIILKQNMRGALMRLDGIEYRAHISAKHNGQSVTGVTLNAKEHYIKAENIKVKLVGGIIADLN